MTRIISFEIEGLAGRTKPVQHVLNDDVNVFWGPNGNGKTSMLKVLHSALTNDVEILRSVAFDSARVEFFSEDRNRTLTRTITSEQVRKVQRTRQPVYDRDQGHYFIWRSSEPSETSDWTTTPKTKNSAVRFSHGWLPITRITDSAPLSRRNHPPDTASRLTEADIDDLFSEGIEGRWQQWRYRSNAEIKVAQDVALTEVLEVALRGVSKRDKSVKPLEPKLAYEVVSTFFGERNPNLGFKFRSYEEFARRYEADPLLRDIVQRLEKVESRISDIEAPQKRLEELIRDLFSNGRKVVFTPESIVVSVRGSDIPLGSLSSGERQLMLILLECLRGGTSTIMIDEPELSMHVAWQNRLVDSMRRVNPRSQLIMATHSPEVMAELADRCVIEL
ncbi:MULTISPECIES: ATP-binding protein [unclassified Mycobacterium]|uniref:ATP-binding protein n=1 Tax=unclassified Mycobacterium TaxID=2642494 RepID=UPI0029C6AF27|nr:MULTISPECIES: ATP-binding protein [unclassified Mycobacterium]